MTKLIVVDNCTQCPYHFRFQNPKLGRICFKVTEKDKETKKETYKLIVSTPKDAIPDWCPLNEKITRTVRAKPEYDRETVEKICKMGAIPSIPQYCDGVFQIELEKWDELLKTLHIDRSEIMEEEEEGDDD